MRNIARLTIIGVSLGIGVQYALDGRWLMVLACGLVGALWVSIPTDGNSRWRSLGLLFFTAAGGAGVFLAYPPIWLLTNFVLLLIAWDLDHFRLALETYGGAADHEKGEAALINAHLYRLGLIAGIGWGLGVLALGVELLMPFALALVLSMLVFFGLWRGIRYFGQDDTPGRGFKDRA